MASCFFFLFLSTLHITIGSFLVPFSGSEGCAVCVRVLLRSFLEASLQNKETRVSYDAAVEMLLLQKHAPWDVLEVSCVY